MTAFARLNATALRRFGVDVVVRVGAVETTLKAVKQTPQAVEQVAGMRFPAAAPTLSFDSAEFAATGAGPNSQIDLGGKTYRIIGPPEPDDEGMTLARLG